MKESTHDDSSADDDPTEQVTIGGRTVVFHYEDIPESDIATVRGLRCTTPVRTVIDIAPELSAAELAAVMDDCLRRRLFTIREMSSRLSRPDMSARRGAALVRAFIDQQGLAVADAAEDLT